MEEPKRRKSRKNYNLVELAISIAIVGIGISSIMSLFSVGLEATRDAIGENYSSCAANQFLIYIARNCNNPGKNFGSGARDFWEEYIYPAPSSEIPETIPSEADENSATFSTTAVEGGIYSSDYPGLYRIAQGSSSVRDFWATIRIWKSTIKNMYIFSQNWSEVSYEYAVKLNIEISWPAEKSYDKRESRYYCMEVFRQEL